MTDAELLDDVALGKSAEELLNDPTISRAFADIEKALSSRILGAARSGKRDVQHEMDLIEALGMVRNAFMAYINNGVVAEKKLDSRRSLFKSRR